MEANAKYCPLNASVSDILLCATEKCAWWDEEAQECSILSLAKATRKVSKNGK